MEITAWKKETLSGDSAALHITYLPGPRQKRPGGRGNQRFIDINEAGNRRGWTHTWLRSNQPQASVLTPSDVPPPSHFSYPVLPLLLCRPSFKDPLHLVVVSFPWVPHFPTMPFLRVFPLLFSKRSRLHENQDFPKHFSTLFLLQKWIKKKKISSFFCFLVQNNHIKNIW